MTEVVKSFMMQTYVPDPESIAKAEKVIYFLTTFTCTQSHTYEIVFARCPYFANVKMFISLLPINFGTNICCVHVKTESECSTSLHQSISYFLRKAAFFAPRYLTIMPKLFDGKRHHENLLFKLLIGGSK